MKIILIFLALPMMCVAQASKMVPKTATDIVNACKVIHQPGYQRRYNKDGAPGTVTIEEQRREFLDKRIAAEDMANGRTPRPVKPATVPPKLMKDFQAREYQWFEDYRPQFTAADAATNIPPPAAQTTVDTECKRLKVATGQ